MSFRGNSEVKLKKQIWDYARIKHSEFSNAYFSISRGGFPLITGAVSNGLVLLQS